MQFEISGCAVQKWSQQSQRGVILTTENPKSVTTALLVLLERVPYGPEMLKQFLSHELGTQVLVVKTIPSAPQCLVTLRESNSQDSNVVTKWTSHSVDRKTNCQTAVLLIQKKKTITYHETPLGQKELYVAYLMSGLILGLKFCKNITVCHLPSSLF